MKNKSVAFLGRFFFENKDALHIIVTTGRNCPNTYTSILKVYNSINVLRA
jgi:hypothetical protein